MNTTRLAAALACATALGAAPLAGQDTFQWNGRVAEGAAVEIKGVNGAVRAVAANGPEVRVTATKSARRSNTSEVRIEVLQHAGGVTLCAVYPSRRQANECRAGSGGRMNVENNDVQVEWVVQVPRGVRFIGRTVNGDVDATGLASDVEAMTVNGGVRIGTAGLARATTVNGSIDVAMGRTDWPRGLKFETVNGGINLAVGGDLSAEVSATTVNGDITTDFPLEVRGRFGPRRLSGTVGSGGRELQLTTVNGDITLRRR